MAKGRTSFCPTFAVVLLVALLNPCGSSTSGASAAPPGRTCSSWSATTTAVVRSGSRVIRVAPRLASTRWLAHGVLFERAYCNSPLCTPSRQSLITGMLPHAVGVTQLTTRLSDRRAHPGRMAARPGLPHGRDRQDALQRASRPTDSPSGSTQPDWERLLRAQAPREAATAAGLGGRFWIPPRSGSIPTAIRRDFPKSRWRRRTSSTRRFA